jgi:hypothetical protein
MILGMGFLGFFGVFLFPNISMQSFYIMNINKNITIMVIKLLFFITIRVFLGFFLFPNISKYFHFLFSKKICKKKVCSSFYIMNIHKYYHIQFEVFRVFLGFFISKYFHAVILHNESK